MVDATPVGNDTFIVRKYSLSTEEKFAFWGGLIAQEIPAGSG